MFYTPLNKTKVWKQNTCLAGRHRRLGAWSDARGGRLQRRQDLPAEAHWTAAELRRVAEALGDNFGVLFVALSYRWLSQGDPGALSCVARVRRRR